MFEKLTCITFLFHFIRLKKAQESRKRICPFSLLFSYEFVKAVSYEFIKAVNTDVINTEESAVNCLSQGATE